jgi:hypothetical protein
MKLLIEMQGKKIIILIKLMLIFLNTIFTMEKDVHDTSSEHDIHDEKDVHDTSFEHDIHDGKRCAR